VSLGKADGAVVSLCVNDREHGIRIWICTEDA